MVQKRIERTAVIVLITASYAKNLGIDRNEQSADSASVASAAHQDTQQPNAIKADAAHAAARLTKTLRASSVLNTSAPIAKARSNRRATTETTALEWTPRHAANAAKPATLRTIAPFRYATNAVKPATARTNAPFVHAMHVVFELTNYQPAICVLNMYALCVTARKNQKATTTRYAPVLSAKHASFSAT